MPASRDKRAVLLALAMLLAAACTIVTAQPRTRGGAAVGDQRMVALRGTASGTVVAIDAAARKLTLRGKLGEGVFRLDPKAGALEGIKAGDTVSLDYVAGIGLTVRRGEAEPRVPAQPADGSAGPARTTVVARVLAIDSARATVKVRGPKGQVAEFPVQDKADLAGLRVGDWLVAVVYELAAVEVKAGAR